MKIFLLVLLITVIKSAPTVENDTVEKEQTFSDLDRELDFDIAVADSGPAKVKLNKK